MFDVIANTADPIAFGVSCIPHPAALMEYPAFMGDRDTKGVLWRNVLALMKRRYGGENLSRFSRDVGVGPASATRIKEAQTSVGIDLLDQIADAFEVEPWQLIAPHLGADAAAVQPQDSFTSAEREIIASLRVLPRRVRDEFGASLEARAAEYREYLEEMSMRQPAAPDEDSQKDIDAARAVLNRAAEKSGPAIDTRRAHRGSRKPHKKAG